MLPRFLPPRFILLSPRVRGIYSPGGGGCTDPPPPPPRVRIAVVPAAGVADPVPLLCGALPHREAGGREGPPRRLRPGARGGGAQGTRVVVCGQSGAGGGASLQAAPICGGPNLEGFSAVLPRGLALVSLCSGGCDDPSCPTISFDSKFTTEGTVEE